MYKKTIGLEVHVELNTNSKFFSSSLNNYNSLPNHNVNYIDLAYPGTLPTLNKEAINQGIRAAILLNAIKRCILIEKIIFIQIYLKTIK
mgnify:CR=1 FL=1